jgi:hypothetical protein
MPVKVNFGDGLVRRDHHHNYHDHAVRDFLVAAGADREPRRKRHL